MAELKLYLILFNFNRGDRTPACAHLNQQLYSTFAIIAKMETKSYFISFKKIESYIIDYLDAIFFQGDS